MLVYEFAQFQQMFPKIHKREVNFIKQKSFACFYSAL